MDEPRRAGVEIVEKLRQRDETWAKKEDKRKRDEIIKLTSTSTRDGPPFFVT